MTPDIPIPSSSEVERYFNRLGLLETMLGVYGEMGDSDCSERAKPFPPNLVDLYRLHRLVRSTSRTTVLEVGCGWSTLVMADALARNEESRRGEVECLRRSNPFELHAVDTDPEWIKIALSRIPKALQPRVFVQHSPARMGEFDSRICTYYERMPLVNPDFIYIDGPDPSSTLGEVAGVSTRHTDMVPMAADVLRIEHFLLPGTLILVDGRAANARFLRANLQRGWAYRYDKDADQHLFEQIEEPLGVLNEQQLAFYASTGNP